MNLPMPIEPRLLELERCNRLTARYGLTLSPTQIRTVAECHRETLRSTDRVEFGESALPKLIEAFCDSPYLSQCDYEETLIELQEIFYHFKNESLERLSDDELIVAMKSVFDGEGHGSLDYLAGTALERLCARLRGCGEDEE